ncbi:MAG: YdcF family protein [Deltaproteobacteria bacterium]|jgi:uncharacterized SAM-binding protein YcdF (DUF218 family)|nr:YdcF family protein [Deltaproteobacteria bacterium]
MKTLQRKYKKYLIFLFAVIVVAGVVYFAPDYLLYADVPQGSDAVMILDGSDYINRRKEAVFLVKNGYAKFIFTPGRTRFLTKTADGIYSYTGNDIDEINAILEEIKAFRTDAPKKNQNILEQTHTALIIAKQVMERVNISSAIFVSNPYHMRRIKLIADNVFEDSVFKIYCVPSRYSKISTLWLLHIKDIKWIISEYIKIAWFRVYTFLDLTG